MDGDGPHEQVAGGGGRGQPHPGDGATCRASGDRGVGGELCPAVFNRRPQGVWHGTADAFWFLPTFGDSLKRNTVCSVCTSYARHVGEEKRCLHAGASPRWGTWARVALRWPATLHGMAGDLPRTLAITPRPTSGGPRGDAASAWVWAGARGQAVCAGPSPGAPTKRRRRGSRRARPNNWRLSVVRRVGMAPARPI